MTVDASVMWMALAAVVVIAIIGFFVSRPRHDESWRDPQRLFTPAQKRAAINNCGGRCEHSGLLFRCRAAGTAGDHIYPWSKGGPTTMGNLQMLCTSHNSSKCAKIPTRRQIKRLERRRRHYFPPGTNYHVDTFTRERE